MVGGGPARRKSAATMKGWLAARRPRLGGALACATCECAGCLLNRYRTMWHARNASSRKNVGTKHMVVHVLPVKMQAQEYGSAVQSLAARPDDGIPADRRRRGIR